jgi:excisionase family DNA binding protein
VNMLTDNVTTEEAAKYLRLKKQTLEAWRLSGRGPAFLKLGRRVIYQRESLERFMSECQRTSTSDPGPNATVPGLTAPSECRERQPTRTRKADSR